MPDPQDASTDPPFSTPSATVPDSSRFLADRSNVRCRLVLEHLEATREATTVADLAVIVQGRLAERVAEQPPRLCAVRVSLFHRHLPVLADAGLVSFDPDTQVVEPTFDGPTTTGEGDVARDLRANRASSEAGRPAARRH